MEIYDIYNDLDKYSRKIIDKKLILQDAKRNNNEIDKLEPSIYKASTLVTVLSQYYEVTTLINKLASAEDTGYKQRRMAFLESFLDEKISQLFPMQGFKCKVSISMKYNKPRVTLRLLDKLGKERMPHMSEGNFLQELLGFSASLAITECLGSNKFYIDEAFAASSPTSLSKVSAIIDKAIKNGMQMILIDQKDDVYKDIPHREIHLYKDPTFDSVTITKIVDY